MIDTRLMLPKRRNSSSLPRLPGLPGFWLYLQLDGCERPDRHLHLGIRSVWQRYLLGRHRSGNRLSEYKRSSLCGRISGYYRCQAEPAERVARGKSIIISNIKKDMRKFSRIFFSQTKVCEKTKMIILFSKFKSWALPSQHPRPFKKVSILNFLDQYFTFEGLVPKI